MTKTSKTTILILKAVKQLNAAIQIKQQHYFSQKTSVYINVFITIAFLTTNFVCIACLTARLLRDYIFTCTYTYICSYKLCLYLASSGSLTFVGPNFVPTGSRFVRRAFACVLKAERSSLQEGGG